MIREKLVRNQKWYVIIDLIRDCNPSPKPSKIWSEYKKKKDPAFKTSTHKFQATNGRIYELECVSEKEAHKVVETFSPKRTAAPKVTTTNTSGYVHVVEPDKKDLTFKALVAAIRNLADLLEKSI